MSDYVDHTFHYLKGGRYSSGPIYDEYRDEWLLRPCSRNPKDFPVHVDVETTTMCNLECKMCFQSFDPPEPLFMEPEVVYDIIKQCSGRAYSMKFQYRGEPLIDPNMVDYIKAAKRAGITEVMINTNANLLDEELAEDLICSGLDKIICSVEGSNKDVYNQTRIGGDWDRVVKNIDFLRRAREDYGYNTPRIRVQMVKTANNANDVMAFHTFWKDKADEVAVEDELDYHAEVPDRTVLENWACPQLYQRLIILADGDMVPCCRSIAGGTEKQILLGNVKSMSIEKAWNGNLLCAVRRMHEEDRSHEVDMCARCGLRKDMVRKVQP